VRHDPLPFLRKAIIYAPGDITRTARLNLFLRERGGSLIGESERQSLYSFGEELANLRTFKTSDQAKKVVALANEMNKDWLKFEANYYALQSQELAPHDRAGYLAGVRQAVRRVRNREARLDHLKQRDSELREALPSTGRISASHETLRPAQPTSPAAVHLNLLLGPGAARASQNFQHLRGHGIG
jgi:hypothetical protein